jgi:hypothetical protein
MFQDEKESNDVMLLAEEKILYSHLEYVKQEAQLITVEGEIITLLENEMREGESYDMKKYLDTAQEIAEKKLQMYADLLSNIKQFKAQFL